MGLKASYFYHGYTINVAHDGKVSVPPMHRGEMEFVTTSLDQAMRWIDNESFGAIAKNLC